MATKYIDPCGDADGGVGLLVSATSGTTAVAASQAVVRGWHKYSYFHSIVSGSSYCEVTTALGTTSGRININIYVTAYPSSLNTMAVLTQTGLGTAVLELKMNTDGTIQLWNSSTAQIGVSTAAIPLNRWVRVTLLYSLTSTTVNQIILLINGQTTNNLTNTTLTAVTPVDLLWGNISGNGQQFYTSDIYIDDSAAMTDPGDIWITARRPFSNGSLNQFATAGSASAYGTGHASYVNERPLNTTDKLTVTPVAVQTEEYTVEAKNNGDVDISLATIIDYVAWANALIASTANTPVSKVICNNVGTTVTLTTAAAFYFSAFAGSSTYPAGNTDVGFSQQFTTTGALTTLNECGLLFAVTFPASPGAADVLPRTFNKFVGPMAMRNKARLPVRPRTPDPLPLTQTIQEDFQFDDAIDTVKWGNWGGSNNTVQDDGTNHYLVMQSVLGGNYFGMDSNSTYELTGSQVTARVLSAGNQTITSWEVYPILLTDRTVGSANQMWVIIAQGAVIAEYKLNGVTTNLGSVSYNPATMVYFRIRESLGIIYWEYSADYNSWTVIQSAVKPNMNIHQMAVSVQVGTWQAESSTTQAWIDDINVGPGGLQINWAGYTWNKRIKSGPSMYNSLWDPNNVGVVDGNGYLPLTISNPQGVYAYGGEIFTQKKSFGYGTYILTIGTEVDNMDQNIVWGGAFTFNFSDPNNSYDEIDIGEVRYYSATPGQLLQSHAYGPSETFISNVGNVSSNGVQTFRIIWNSYGIQFDAFAGPDTSGVPYQSTYQNTNLPNTDQSRVHINIWAQNIANPSNIGPMTVIMRNFQFFPDAPQYRIPRIPNPKVGPMALRRRAHRPYVSSVAIATAIAVNKGAFFIVL